MGMAWAFWGMIQSRRKRSANSYKVALSRAAESAMRR